MTEDGVITPTRLQQGSVDSSLHFQQSVEKILREADLLYKHVLAWVDDLLIYANTIDEFLEVLDRVYRTLAHYGLFLGLDKICLYTQNAKWCGRVITPDVIAYDPEKIKTLINIPEPQTAAELQQFLCAAGWMRNSLIDFARVAALLHDRLQATLVGTKRTKQVAARLSITLSDQERSSFIQMKQLLANSATLVTPDDSDELIVMTDASDLGWSIILTVVHDWDPTVSITEQTHQLVYCMSGTFKGASKHWRIFATVKAASDLDYLLIRSKGFRLYSDHRNLIFIFAPGEDIKKHVRGKLQRWSLKLNELRYTIEHISGEANVWADMVSRWAPNTTGAVDSNDQTLANTER
ncbi:hypothetical protein PHPALM_31143 [Phytophthora palmivora]|uniref:Reverse transcriptase domain-containing protein n=1 Tax=Phytophthora palmivora TaxID=4796 RepID=A0A2P4X3C6_9STRA|nr:hypothetical protein PHPALM_31143 [Phytophthora palmivora]